MKPSNKIKWIIRRYKEIKLKKDIAVRYLLKLSELKDDHKYWVTDLYWSLHIYKIKRVIIERNSLQLILYYLKDKPIELTTYLIGQNPKWSFKYKKLQVIEKSDKIKYPPDEFIQKYYPTRFVYYI